MDHDPNKTDERHNDMNELNAVVAKGVALLLKVLIPLAVAAVLTLVANHWQQKQMAKDISSVTTEIKEMRKEANVMSHKIAIMWAGGNWEAKYRSDKDGE